MPEVNDRPPVLGMILKGYPRISETFIAHEIRLLEEAGLAIRILSMRPGREAITHPVVRAIRARVDYLPETFWKNAPRLLYRNSLLCLRRPRRYAAGLKLALRRLGRSGNPASLRHFLQAGWLVEKLLAGSGIAHFHAHFAHSPASVALYASALSGLPFSFTAHAKDIYTTDPAQLREKIARASFVVTCTRYNARHLGRIAGGLSTPIHCFYHGIDTRFFDSGPELRFTARPPYRILTVARLIAKKGIPTILRALARLKSEGLPFDYTLVGEGPEREKVEGLVRGLGLGGGCRLAGTLAHEAVREEYRRADLFVLASEVAADGDRDGIPNVLVEAMSMGVPVAATRVSAIPELVADEETGLLVSPGDEEALAAAMRRLLVDRELRRRVLPAARARVRAEFDNRRLAGELALLHRQALEQASRGGPGGD